MPEHLTKGLQSSLNEAPGPQSLCCEPRHLPHSGFSSVLGPSFSNLSLRSFSAVCMPVPYSRNQCKLVVLSYSGPFFERLTNQTFTLLCINIYYFQNGFAHFGVVACNLGSALMEPLIAVNTQDLYPQACYTQLYKRHGLLAR